MGLAVFLFGLYIVLRVSGLTRLALTVVGGTGILGLVIGIAFRDITENFLASVFLSIQRPFLIGDLVEIEGVQGYVQQLSVRTTVLMTFTGNHVQIPNATVYKSILRNFTSNPNRRDDFAIGIGYGDNITEAQSVALKVLQVHEGVLDDPEPWVLVDSLGTSAVVLRVYYWIDTSQHSFLKVRSSVIRLIKQASTENGLSIPDEGREIVFPQGVPVHLIQDDGSSERRRPQRVARATAEPKVVSTEAEGGLETEAEQIKEQARKARVPEASEPLMEGAEMKKE
jgi:small-conductance mechanosensitive channel